VDRRGKSHNRKIILELVELGVRTKIA